MVLCIITGVRTTTTTTEVIRNTWRKSSRQDQINPLTRPGVLQGPRAKEEVVAWTSPRSANPDADYNQDRNSKTTSAVAWALQRPGPVAFGHDSPHAAVRKQARREAYEASR